MWYYFRVWRMWGAGDPRNDSGARENIDERRWYKMPEVSRFYGIVVKMFFKPKEHDPSHIHAIYGECVGVFDLASLEMTDGDLPLTA